jgi:hypothetical protein
MSSILNVEQFTYKFNNFINQFLAKSNKYFLGGLGVISVAMVSSYIQPSTYRFYNITNNVFFKLLVLFILALIVLKQDPTTSLIIAISILALLHIMAHLSGMENMSPIDDKSMESIPQYSVNTCDQPAPDCEDSVNQQTIEEPIAGISEGEMQSLCGHVQSIDPLHQDEMMGSSDFSELVSPEKVQSFAEQQFKTRRTNVSCAKNVIGNSDNRHLDREILPIRDLPMN